LSQTSLPEKKFLERYIQLIEARPYAIGSQKLCTVGL